MVVVVFDLLSHGLSPFALVEGTGRNLVDGAVYLGDPTVRLYFLLLTMSFCQVLSLECFECSCELN